MKSLIIAAAVAGGVAVTPPCPCHGYPGDPMPGCESTLFATYCDGPIRPNNTFQRCWQTIGQWTYYGGFGGGRYCNTVDLNGPWPVIPVGAPQHHIDQ
jgi:hypothetical protein